MAAQQTSTRLIGYWMTNKKIEKLNVSNLKELCGKKGYVLVRLDLTRNIEEQGPFCIIFHKCTDLIVDANAGDKKCQEMVQRLEQYLSDHPEVPIVDPLENIRRVLDRHKSYLALQKNTQLTSNGAFLPTSVVLSSSSPSVNIETLKAAGVQFPFLSKPLVAHGNNAHEMAVIFNEAGVADCILPTFAQAFVNHNARLHKIFCVGDRYVTVTRSSLKNFYKFEAQKTVHFSSSAVSRLDSTSSLTMLDEDDPMRSAKAVGLDRARLDGIVAAIREEIGMTLMGFDVVIDNESGRYAVIDVNAFPGYDGFPEVWEAVLAHLERVMREHVSRTEPSTTSADSAVPPIGGSGDLAIDSHSSR